MSPLMESICRFAGVEAPASLPQQPGHLPRGRAVMSGISVPESCFVKPAEHEGQGGESSTEPGKPVPKSWTFPGRFPVA